MCLVRFMGMMRILSLALLPLLPFSLAAVSQDAVAPSSPPATAGSEGDTQTDEDTLTVDVDLVQVLFTVTDDDRQVPGLVEEDFIVYEDGVRQEIVSFEAETDLPLTLVVAMDTSGSVRTKLEFEQDAAVEFFFTVIERRRDEGMLVTFDSSVQVLQDFTDSPERLSEAVRQIRVGGSSSMYDAIYLAIAQKVAQRPEGGRRIMVVVSDGDDNSSEKTLEEALEVAQRNDVVIYTISTNSTADFGADRQERGDRLLEELAEETGGRSFYPLELEDLVETLEGIVSELRSQYEITYVSSNPARDGAFREIEIRPCDGGHSINARAGYYAPLD